MTDVPLDFARGTRPYQGGVDGGTAQAELHRKHAEIDGTLAAELPQLTRSRQLGLPRPASLGGDIEVDAGQEPGAVG